MSDNTSSGGDNSAASGAADGNESVTSGSDKGYPKEFVEKLKKEKDNHAKAAHALRAELESFKAALQDREKQELEEKQEFKKLYEAEKARAETVSKDLAGMQERIKQATINTQIRNELVKRGLDEAHVETALKLVDRSAVAIDPATQSVVGADEVAKKFHEAHAGLGFFKKSSAGTNQSATLNITSGAPDYSKLSQEQKLKLLSTMKRNA